MAKFKFPGNMGNMRGSQNSSEQEFNKLMKERDINEQRQKWETVQLTNAAIFRAIEGLTQYKETISPEAYEAASNRLSALHRQGGIAVVEISENIEKLTGTAPTLIAPDKEDLSEKTKEVLELVITKASKEFPKQ